MKIKVEQLSVAVAVSLFSNAVHLSSICSQDKKATLSDSNWESEPYTVTSSASLFLMTVFRVHYIAASLTSAQSPARSVRQADSIQLYVNLPLDSPIFRSAALPHQVSLISGLSNRAESKRSFKKSQNRKSAAVQ